MLGSHLGNLSCRPLQIKILWPGDPELEAMDNGAFANWLREMAKEENNEPLHHSKVDVRSGRVIVSKLSLGRCVEIPVAEPYIERLISHWQ